MKFNLSQANLSSLQEKTKLINYVSSAFTRTYFRLSKGKLSILFRGAKGGLKISVDLEGFDEAETKYFMVDYSKWSNALSKMTFADQIECTLTDKSLRIAIPGSKDVIALGIISYEAGSSEVDSFEELIKPLDNAHDLLYEETIGDAFSLSISLFSSAGKNNAVSVQTDKVVYADRSIVVAGKINKRNMFLGARNQIDVHRFLIGFMMIANRFNSLFGFSEDYDKLYWTADGVEALIASEPCDISIPSSEELAEIGPVAGTAGYGTIVVDHRALHACLGFFNGFYEASAWKPITIRRKDGITELYYKHPTTEISKSFDATSTSGEDGEFMISSEALDRILSRSIEKTSDNKAITFSYDATAPGVSCIVGDHEYDVMFGKLVE